MASRKRDSYGRFAPGAGGTALQQFGQESMQFKRPRTVQPTMPGYPGAVGEFSSAGQGPPQAGALGVGYSSGVIDIASNSTSSLPVQARPWSPQCAVGDFSPGSLLFVRKDLEHASYKSVADLATANWLLRDARSALAANGANPEGEMGAESHAGKNGWLADKGGWNFMGSLRNKYLAPGSLITLMNVDVFGRSKIGNIFSKKLQTGDRVGIALVPVNILMYRTIEGPGSGSANPVLYVESLLPDGNVKGTPLLNPKKRTRSATELLIDPTSKDDGADYTDANKFTVWQWLPTHNGRLCKHTWTLFDASKVDDKKGPDVDFIDHISLGCVSNALMCGKSHEAHMRRALMSTDAYTTLPQIEILIE